MAPPLPDPVVYPAAVLRVTPDVIPDLRRAIDDTLRELTPHLQLMQDGAFIPEPWLGDSVSYDMWKAYNDNVMGALDGPFHALTAYQRQLLMISDRLREIQRNYEDTEATNADMMSGLS